MAASKLNEVLPEGLCASAYNGLGARIYVSSPKVVLQADLLIKRYGAYINCVYVHRPIVPVDEMDRRSLIRNMGVDFADAYPVGSWVRVRDGLYKGDIARVYSSRSSTDELDLVLAPRYDASLEGLRTAFKGPMRGRPPQCLCDFSLIPTGELQDGPITGTYTFGDDVYFENGLKFVTVHGLHYASVCRPSAAEVWFFTLAGEDTRMETNKSLLRSSDRVRVLAGVDVGKMGVVIAKYGANDEAVEVDVQEDTIRLYNVAYIERVFEVGDTVSVVLGSHSGQEGMIVDIADKNVTIMVDEGKTEV